LGRILRAGINQNPAAIALMRAGADNLKTNTPGFPENGHWKVSWEGQKAFP
jgi:protein-glucosylgalactosylhydroxylysine glucosidase